MDQIIYFITAACDLFLETAVETFDFGINLIRSIPDLISQSVSSYTGKVSNLRGAGISQSIAQTGKMLWKKYDTTVWNLRDGIRERRQYRLTKTGRDGLLPELDIDLH